MNIISIFLLILISASAHSGENNTISQLILKDDVYYHENVDSPSLDIGSESKINDNDLIVFQNLDNLRTLHLQVNNLTEKGFQNIKYLHNLHVLTIRSSNFTDTSMQYLSDLVLLERLDLEGTKITDKGLVYLKNLNKLNFLYIGETDVTDAGIQYIIHSDLHELALNKTRLSDNGLKILEQLDLQILYLANTNITDASIPVLKNFKNLRILDIQGTKISRKGVEKLLDFFYKNRRLAEFHHD